MAKKLTKQEYLEKRYDKLIKEAQNLMKEYGLDLIPIKVNPRLKTSQGRFVFFEAGDSMEPFEIELNTSMLVQEDDVFRQILLHEVAHYITRSQHRYLRDPHGEEFVDTCHKIGCTLTRAYNNTVRQLYSISCSECGKYCGGTFSKAKANKYTAKHYHSRCCDSSLKVEINKDIEEKMKNFK